MAFVKSTTTIDKSTTTIDKSKAMFLIFQGKYDFILGEKGEKSRSSRDSDGMWQGARRHVVRFGLEAVYIRSVALIYVGGSPY